MAIKKRKTTETIGEFVDRGGSLPGSGSFDPKGIPTADKGGGGGRKETAKTVETPGISTAVKPSSDVLGGIGKLATGIKEGRELDLGKPSGEQRELIKGAGAGIAGVGAAALATVAALKLTAAVGAAAAAKATPWTNPEWWYLFSQKSGYVFGSAAVRQAAKVGTLGISTAAKGTAGKIASNAVTSAITSSWFTKIAIGLGLTMGAVSLAKDMIGTYPFAGFLEEEAIQTLGFATEGAYRNNDVEGMEAAISEGEEVLRLIAEGKRTGIPYKNVLESLDTFNKAATIKLQVDKKRLEDLKLKLAGESDDEKWARIRQEEADQDKAAVDYYNQQSVLHTRWKREAEVAGRNEDALFWAREKAKERKREAEDRVAIAEFWMAYRKAVAKSAEDNRPSSLNFGLI